VTGIEAEEGNQGRSDVVEASLELCFVEPRPMPRIRLRSRAHANLGSGVGAGSGELVEGERTRLFWAVAGTFHFR